MKNLLAIHNLSARDHKQQFGCRLLDVIGSRIKRFPVRAGFNVVGASLLILCNGGLNAAPIYVARHFEHQSQLFATDPTGVCPGVAQLAPQGCANGVGHFIELFDSGELTCAPKTQLGADNNAANCDERGEGPWIEINECVNFSDQFPLLFRMLKLFFAGLFGTVAIGLLVDIRRHGLNMVWRATVLDWPIPYWMRFVPKCERDQ